MVSDPENRVDDQDIGSLGSPVCSGLQVAGEPEHCRARSNTIVELNAAFSFRKSLNCTGRDA